MCWGKPISARQPWTGLLKHRCLPSAGLGLSQQRCTLTARVREASNASSALPGGPRSPSGRTGFATVGGSGTRGSGVWWWEMGCCKSLLLLRLQPPVPPAPLPPVAQRPGGDHSYCLTWKRNSREVPTWFCYYNLKNNLASGKRHVTSRFFVCNYRVPHDAICKYLFWTIFLCPTELFSAQQTSCRSSLGRASPRTPQCPWRLCQHVLPWPPW